MSAFNLTQESIENNPSSLFYDWEPSCEPDEDLLNSFYRFNPLADKPTILKVLAKHSLKLKLYKATKEKDWTVAETLLKGGGVEINEESGSVIFHAVKGDIPPAIFQLYLDSPGIETVINGTANSWHPLTTALVFGNVELAKMIMNHSAFELLTEIPWQLKEYVIMESPEYRKHPECRREFDYGDIMNFIFGMFEKCGFEGGFDGFMSSMFGEAQFQEYKDPELEPLYVATAAGDWDSAEALLKEDGAEICDNHEESGSIIYNFVSENCPPAIFQLYLDAATGNVINVAENSWPPIVTALVMGYIELATMIINHPSFVLKTLPHQLKGYLIRESKGYRKHPYAREFDYDEMLGCLEKLFEQCGFEPGFKLWLEEIIEEGKATA